MINEILNYNIDEVVTMLIKDDPNDMIFEIADGHVDIYYYDIYKSLPDIVDYIEQARDEGLITDNCSIDKQIQIGQFYKYQQELQQQWQWLRDELESLLIDDDLLLSDLDGMSESKQLDYIKLALENI